MPIDSLKSERRWLAIIPIAVIIISVIVWFATRDTLSKTIRVATAHEGGLYHEFGEALQKSLKDKTGRDVVLVQSEGSLENEKLLREGKVDLAIVQGGSATIAGLSVIAPLYPEVVHVVTRQGSAIKSIDDLKSRRVVYGAKGSGMRTSAERILEHYGISKKINSPTDLYFKGLLEEESIDAAIVTTGFMNRDLQEMLASGRFAFCRSKEPRPSPPKIPTSMSPKSPGASTARALQSRPSIRPPLPRRLSWWFARTKASS
jgi:TRAP transporter TAXI family solute receptor